MNKVQGWEEESFVRNITTDLFIFEEWSTLYCLEIKCKTVNKKKSYFSRASRKNCSNGKWSYYCNHWGFPVISQNIKLKTKLHSNHLYRIYILKLHRMATIDNCTELQFCVECVVFTFCEPSLDSCTTLASCFNVAFPNLSVLGKSPTNHEGIHHRVQIRKCYFQTSRHE